MGTGSGDFAEARAWWFESAGLLGHGDRSDEARVQRRRVDLAVIGVRPRRVERERIGLTGRPPAVTTAAAWRAERAAVPHPRVARGRVSGRPVIGPGDRGARLDRQGRR